MIDLRLTAPSRWRIPMRPIKLSWVFRDVVIRNPRQTNVVGASLPCLNDSGRDQHRVIKKYTANNSINTIDLFLVLLFGPARDVRGE